MEFYYFLSSPSTKHQLEPTRGMKRSHDIIVSLSQEIPKKKVNFPKVLLLSFHSQVSVITTAGEEGEKQLTLSSHLDLGKSPQDWRKLCFI